MLLDVVEIDWLGVDRLEELDLSRMLLGGEMMESFLVSHNWAWYCALVLIKLVRNWFG